MWIFGRRVLGILGRLLVAAVAAVGVLAVAEVLAAPDAPVTWRGLALLGVLFVVASAVLRAARDAHTLLRDHETYRLQRGTPAENARHEAAHAVVAHKLGHDVLAVSVRPSARSGGDTQWVHRDNLPSSVDHAAIAYAGPLATGVGNTLPHTSSHEDDTALMWRHAVAASISDPQCLSPHEVIEQAATSARAILAADADAIDRVAAALIQHRTLRGGRGRAHH
jgi:hypothetical protein